MSKLFFILGIIILIYWTFCMLNSVYNRPLVILKHKNLVLIIGVAFIFLGFINRKTCIDFSYRYSSVWIVDPDIMGIKNHITNEFAFVSVECPLNNLYEYLFSRCATCPLYRDNCIKIPPKKHKLCEGDIIFIYNYL